MRSGPSPFDWVVFFSCVAVWGTAFAGLKIAVEDIPPVWVATGRMMVAAVFMAALLPLLKMRLPPLTQKQAWRDYAIIGVIGTAFPFVLFAIAAQNAPSAIVAICNGGTPFFTALLAHATLAGERLSLRRAMSVGLGFAGLVTLTAPGLLESGAHGAETAGVLAAVAGGACYAVANIRVKQAQPLPAVVGTTIYCFAGAAAITPIGLIAAPIPFDAGAASLWAVVLLGVFSTALGGIGFVYLVQRRGPVFTSFSTYLMPLWALGVGMVVLGERPGPQAFVALALILAGLALFNWPTKRSAPPPAPVA